MCFQMMPLLEWLNGIWKKSAVAAIRRKKSSLPRTTKELGCRRSARAGFDSIGSAASAVGCQRPCRLYRRGRRQLERPDDRLFDGNICPWGGRLHLASGCQHGHEYWPEAHGRCSKSACVIGADLFPDRQMVSDARADFHRQMNGSHLSVRHPHRTEAAVELP